jgi:hypothetical protein
MTAFAKLEGKSSLAVRRLVPGWCESCGGAADRKQHAQAVVEILDFVRMRGLTLDDLIQIGGKDFRSAPTRIEKARRVEKCWSLMARLSVKFTDLEQTPQPIPDKRSRRRRGEGSLFRSY